MLSVMLVKPHAEGSWGITLGSRFKTTSRDPRGSKGTGATITSIRLGSLADQSNLKLGDILLHLDKEDAEHTQFEEIVAMIKLGTGALNLEVKRLRLQICNGYNMQRPFPNGHRR